MFENLKVIPIAVVVAVAVFLARELLELIRRWKQNGRKLTALRRLLAMECEKNNFAISRLRGQVEEVEEARQNDHIIALDERASGPRLTIHSAKGLEASSPLPRIHTSILESYLFEAASLDPTLFDLMGSALEGVVDATHVRESLIEYVTVDREHLEGFAEYAVRELDDAVDRIGALYFHCTTEPLAAGRVR